MNKRRPYLDGQSINRALVDRTDGLVNRLGSGLLFHERTLAYAREAGVDNAIVLYAGGRAGVMGDVSDSQVTAAFGFFDPAAVREGWASVSECAAPSEIARIYAEAMAEAGRHWFADDEVSATVARVGWMVADRVEALGLSLFAGWREMRPVADDAKGSAALALITLRELRGDIHLQSVAAAGLSALEAELLTRGPDGARVHGWPEPYPDVASVSTRMLEANDATSTRMQRCYGLVDREDVQSFMAAVGVTAEVLAEA